MAWYSQGSSFWQQKIRNKFSIVFHSKGKKVYLGAPNWDKCFVKEKEPFSGGAGCVLAGAARALCRRGLSMYKATP